mgnify:CR=1 FL=1
MKESLHYLLMSDHFLFQKSLAASVRDTGLTPGQPKILDYLINRERAVHCKHFTKTDWGNVKNYDLCIKSDDFGVEDTAKIIRKLFQKKMGV